MNYPDRIPYAAWINSQLSIARHYGGMTIQGKDYLIEHGTGDLVYAPKPAPKPRKKKSTATQERWGLL